VSALDLLSSIPAFEAITIPQGAFYSHIQSREVISLGLTVSWGAGYLSSHYSIGKFISSAGWSIALVVTRWEARAEEHTSFYIAFRLQNDLNPGIDNRWNRSDPPLREPIYTDHPRDCRRPWSTNLNLTDSYEI